MSVDDNTSQIIEFEARATQATHRRVAEHARYSGKRVKKPHRISESQIEDEFFKLADRMGGEAEEPDWQKQQSHTNHPEREHKGQQRLWRELQWQAEQHDRGPQGKRPNKKSGAKATGKSNSSLTRKKAA